MRKLFSYRDARLLVAGQTLSAFGDFAMWIVMAVWMKTLTGSSARAGLVFFVLALGSLAGPAGGLLADRVRRRPLMIATDCLLGTAVLLLLFVHDAGEAWLIYLVALLYGVGGSVFYPARSALLRVMLPEDVLADANGILSSTQQGVRIVAPLVGAGLFAAFGGGVVAILDAATFAGSALFLARMRVAEEKPQPPEQHFVAEVTAGFRHVWQTLPLRQLTIGATVALLVVGFT
jgi:MFS family permease